LSEFQSDFFTRKFHP